MHTALAQIDENLERLTKWQLKSIYGKLGVSSRDEAIARGHDLNLIH